MIIIINSIKIITIYQNNHNLSTFYSILQFKDVWIPRDIFCPCPCDRFCSCAVNPSQPVGTSSTTTGVDVGDAISNKYNNPSVDPAAKTPGFVGLNCIPVIEEKVPTTPTNSIM